jgi:proteasome lid subunit RPN8/RPN11
MLARVLKFSPTAWAKLLYFRDIGRTEISGFGITPADDPLYVEDFVTIKQETTVASISLDDDSVSKFFDDMVDLGKRPAQFGRIWIHTHPGNSPSPSYVDEETFARAFGCCDYAIMMIVAMGGSTYARLRFNVGPKADVVIPVQVDYSKKFPGSDPGAWETEYDANIKANSGFAIGFNGPADVWDGGVVRYDFDTYYSDYMRGNRRSQMSPSLPGMNNDTHGIARPTTTSAAEQKKEEAKVFGATVADDYGYCGVPLDQLSMQDFREMSPAEREDVMEEYRLNPLDYGMTNYFLFDDEQKALEAMADQEALEAMADQEERLGG